LFIERVVAFGKRAWEWAEEHWPDLPDIGATAQPQLDLLKQVVDEQDPTKKRQRASELAASLTPAQLLVLVGLVVAASAAADSGAGAGSR
jgi:hypothetical protein